MEILASWSVNYYANQTPPTVREAYAEFKKQAKRFFDSVNIWRAIRDSDLSQHFALSNVKGSDGKYIPLKDPITGKNIPLNRAHLSRMFIELFDSSELQLYKYLTEELNLHVFVALPYEGDTIVTSHHGFHDVMYLGGPSYQVSNCYCNRSIIQVPNMYACHM